MSDVKAKVRKFIEDNFIMAAQAARFDDAESFIDHQIIDSTGFLELVAYLEEAYGIAISDDEMIPENLDSLNAIEVFMNRKQTA